MSKVVLPVTTNTLPSGDIAFHRQQVKQLREQIAELTALADRHEDEVWRAERAQSAQARASRQTAYDNAPLRTVDRTVTPVCESMIHSDDLHCTRTQPRHCLECGHTGMHGIGIILSAGVNVSVCRNTSCQVVVPLDGRLELTFKTPPPVTPELHVVGQTEDS